MHVDKADGRLVLSFSFRKSKGKGGREEGRRPTTAPSHKWEIKPLSLLGCSRLFIRACVCILSLAC